MLDNSSFSGQIILIGTVVAEGYNPKVAKGSRCAMISVVDCDNLSQQGLLDNYILDDGLDAGLLLDETLGQFGWRDIRVKNALPLSDDIEGYEPEVIALIKTAAKIGVAHMVFEPSAEPQLLH